MLPDNVTVPVVVMDPVLVIGKPYDPVPVNVTAPAFISALELPMPLGVVLKALPVLTVVAPV
jgi:hypothetical protein